MKAEALGIGDQLARGLTPQRADGEKSSAAPGHRLAVDRDAALAQVALGAFDRIGRAVMVQRCLELVIGALGRALAVDEGGRAGQHDASIASSKPPRSLLMRRRETSA